LNRTGNEWEKIRRIIVKKRDVFVGYIYLRTRPGRLNIGSI
jgi:hypothetical protein